MEQVRKLTKDGATILILHHAGKNQSKYRGSSEILAAVDVAFHMEKIGGEKNPVSLKLECLKHRFVEEFNINLEFKITDGKAILRDITIDPEKEDLQKINRWIRNFRKDKKILPNQSQLLDGIKEEYVMGKDKCLKLLKIGEGEFWKSLTEGKGRSRIYKPFTSVNWNDIPD